MAAFADPLRDQIFDRRHSVFFCKGMDDVIFAGMDDLLHGIQRDIFFVVAVYIAAHGSTQMAALLWISRNQSGREFRVSV